MRAATAVEEVGGELEPVEVVDAELVDVDDAPGGEVAVHDPAAAVLAALEEEAEEDLWGARAAKSRTGYARDWVVWQDFHDWLAERKGHRLPDTAVTRGTMVAFVKWLDQVVKAPPNTIDRRVTGVTVTARRPPYRVEVPKEATLAARELIRKWRLDPVRMARGRGKAAALTPEDVRAMAGAPRERPPRPDARRRRVLVVPELARLRDQAMHSMKLAVAGRNEEMSELDDPNIQVVDEGLTVHVPSVKGRPARDVPVTPGEHRETCPVRCWLAWHEAKLAAGAEDGGPAYLPVDQWGHLGTARLSPDGVGRALARCARYAGLSGRRITGHSARRGLVTTGRKKGKRVEKLRRQGGWSTNSPVFWEYVDEGELFEDAPTKGIGL
ncbi:hypothetical protein [Streptomyces nanshensis]|uniref:Integrase n=1 Tax=Streptomyces nanshensis TaxID=518642 RepID=A0A1E7LA01_9ACTN|nr:hypothetical protein [Streptomyces nanshensis]OEV12984.1 hypothetical protein AN218_05595 [Streptomyces nanshensis]